MPSIAPSMTMNASDERGPSLQDVFGKCEGPPSAPPERNLNARELLGIFGSADGGTEAKPDAGAVTAESEPRLETIFGQASLYCDPVKKKTRKHGHHHGGVLLSEFRPEPWSNCAVGFKPRLACIFGLPTREQCSSGAVCSSKPGLSDIFLLSNVEEEQLLPHQPKIRNACSDNGGIVACSYAPDETANFAFADAAGLSEDEHFAQIHQANLSGIAPKLTDIFGMPACQRESQAIGATIRAAEDTLPAGGHRLGHVFGQLQEDCDSQSINGVGEAMHLSDPKLADVFGSLSEDGDFMGKQIPWEWKAAVYHGGLQSTAEASQAPLQDGLSTCSTSCDEEAACTVTATSPTSGNVGKSHLATQELPLEGRCLQLERNSEVLVPFSVTSRLVQHQGINALVPSSNISSLAQSRGF